MRSPLTPKAGGTPVYPAAEESTTATIPTIPTSRVGAKRKYLLVGGDYAGPLRPHEQQLRILEKKPDVPDRRQGAMALERSEDNSRLQGKSTARESEFPVSPS